MAHKAERVLKHRANLGEGALWAQTARMLYWVDILDRRIMVFDPATNANREIPVAHYPSAIVPRARGGAMIAVERGFAALDLETGRVSMVAEIEADIPSNRFNDGKCDPAGRFWAGSMDFDLAPEKGALYSLDRDRKVSKALEKVSCSNGIVWSADRKSMYYIDSLTQRVDAFDYDFETGSIARRGTAVEIPKEVGFPDGMAIDSEDMIWVALYGGGRVNRYNPKTGRFLDAVLVPGANLVTSCAFGGADLGDLYITTASCGYDDADWKGHPEAGSLFRARTGAVGVPAGVYGG